LTKTSIKVYENTSTIIYIKKQSFFNSTMQ